MKFMTSPFKAILLLTVAVFSLSACKENTKTVLVVGDSWAFFVCGYKSLDRALKKVEITNVETNSTCGATTLVGMRASKWKDSANHKATLVNLADPSVKVLYLSLGGNDIMNAWNKSMNSHEEAEAFNKIKNDLGEIVQIYKELRPDVKILISGYDFARFTPNHVIAHYKQAYTDMGEPSPLEMNEALVRFSNTMAELADFKQVFYIHHLGLMHYYYGNSDVGLSSYSTLSPEFISPPQYPTDFGGDLRFLTDRKAMANIGGGEHAIIDAFHLGKTGYDKLADHTVMHYLKDWFKVK